MRFKQQRVVIDAHWARTGDWLRYGTALLTLGTEWLSQAQLSEAETCYQDAERLFHLRVDPAQRQNEAAAVYGLALVAVLQEQPFRALELTEQAVALLQEAEQHWVMIHADYERADHCEMLRQRIAKLSSKYWPPGEWKIADSPGYGVNFLALPGSEELFIRRKNMSKDKDYFTQEFKMAVTRLLETGMPPSVITKILAETLGLAQDAEDREGEDCQPLWMQTYDYDTIAGTGSRHP